MNAMGVQAVRPLQLACLAGAHGKVEEVEEGLALIDKALETANRNEERCYEAEIHRLRGELLLQQGEAKTEAQHHYEQAIEVARRQSARSWELRATTSLCRLWQAQGRRKEARRKLAGIYGWFSEGFDTADLKEAKALLDELS
jgi:predicted ATPase